MNTSNNRIDWPRLLLGVCRQIETSTDVPSLSDLAAVAGVSPAQLQRQFKQRLGVSPKAYVRALQLHRLASHAAQNSTTLDAVYDAGFQSASAAYSQAKAAFGAPPGKFRQAIRIGWWLGLSDLGWMLMASTSKGICWLSFGHEPGSMLDELHAAFPQAEFYDDEQRLGGWFDQVRDFVLLPREALDLPVDIQGTAFQALVWKALRDIPLGGTLSYSQLAAKIGKPSAVRAVASACARNKVALLIPCHRIIAANGSMAGYRWGLEHKETLLKREAAL